MPLDGVAKKYAKCVKNCKQYRQVTVLVCPGFAKSGITTKIELKDMAESEVLGDES